MIGLFKNKLFYTLVGISLVCVFSISSIYSSVFFPNLIYSRLVGSPRNSFIDRLQLRTINKVGLFPVIRGIELNINNPEQIKFKIDTMGQSKVSQEDIERMVKYFLGFLALPEDKLWVNLSPYEQNRILPEILGKLDLGKDMLVQDYFLKKITALVTSPSTPYGRSYWQGVNKMMQDTVKTRKIALNLFHKVWVVPDYAEIYSCGNQAFIKNAKLKVMMESDYLAYRQAGLASQNNRKCQVQNKINERAKEIFKRELLPVIEDKVNHSVCFAPLRQMYYSFLLATYFRQKMRQSGLWPAYIGQEKVEGLVLEEDKVFKNSVYTAYLRTLEPSHAKCNSSRRYFSGGAVFSSGPSQIMKHVPEIKLTERGEGVFLMKERNSYKKGCYTDVDLSVSIISKTSFVAKRKSGFKSGGEINEIVQRSLEKVVPAVQYMLVYRNRNVYFWIDPKGEVRVARKISDFDGSEEEKQKLLVINLEWDMLPMNFSYNLTTRDEKLNEEQKRVLTTLMLELNQYFIPSDFQKTLSSEFEKKIASYAYAIVTRLRDSAFNPNLASFIVEHIASFYRDMAYRENLTKNEKLRIVMGVKEGLVEKVGRISDIRCMSEQKFAENFFSTYNVKEIEGNHYNRLFVVTQELSILIKQIRMLWGESKDNIWKKILSLQAMLNKIAPNSLQAHNLSLFHPLIEEPGIYFSPDMGRTIKKHELFHELLEMKLGQAGAGDFSFEQNFGHTCLEVLEGELSFAQEVGGFEESFATLEMQIESKIKMLESFYTKQIKTAKLEVFRISIVRWQNHFSDVLQALRPIFDLYSRYQGQRYAEFIQRLEVICSDLKVNNLSVESVASSQFNSGGALFDNLKGGISWQTDFSSEQLPYRLKDKVNNLPEVSGITFQINKSQPKKL